MKLILILFLLSIITPLDAQHPAVVTSLTLNIRTGPSKDSSIMAVLVKNDTVSVLEKYSNGFCKINFRDSIGYAAAQYLLIDEYLYWQRKKYFSGSSPECDNIIPTFDSTINNYLKINVGKNTDVVVKLMKFIDSVNTICIRNVYINHAESYNIRSIPQGYYHLKIAYGIDWRQTIEEGKCLGRFVKNALYEKGTDILDYFIEIKPGGRSIPSYELWLDVISNKKHNSFNSNNITEEEFNR